MLAPDTLGLSPDQEKQHLRGDQVFLVDAASFLLLENMSLIIFWRLQASTRSLSV